jgi:spore coat protein H
MELPTRHIMIGEQERLALQKDVWSDKFVMAYMLLQDKREPIELRYRGGHTREYPKKSYEIVRNGKTYHYNAEFDDPSMIRNALSFQFFQWIGVPSPKAEHCLLQWNGQSQGVYLEIEAVDRNFFKRRGIPVKSLFYAVNDNATFGLGSSEWSTKKSSLFSGYELKVGRQEDVKAWQQFILKLNTLRGTELRRYLMQQVDIDNYLRWLAGAVLTGNYDGFDQNYAVYRHKVKRKYRMIPWDYEGTWGRNCYGKPCSSDLVRTTGYNELTRKLLAFSAFRNHYKKLLNSILIRHFTAKKIDPAVQSMFNSIAPHIYRDYMRKWSVSTFEGEPQFIRNYVNERRAIIKNALKQL